LNHDLAFIAFKFIPLILAFVATVIILLKPSNWLELAKVPGKSLL